ncbi:MAG: TlpA family protein disulfide reductase [Candidatus Eremiobacteraeota bacterium]|nr:TlpA family protein disulfide reductase [Candidatus Eremiobacteraeota bacterium]
MLEVFATWCENCQAEVGALNLLYRKYRSKVDFLAVTGSKVASNQKSPEDDADVLSFAKVHNVMYPVAMDADRVVASKLQVVGFPAIFMIDRQHKVVYQIYGRTPFDELDSAVKAHLETAPITSQN